jgi:Spy/CpxP family protein refolding chaperone
MAETPPSVSARASYGVAAVFALGVVFGAALSVILLHLHGGMPMPFARHGGPHAGGLGSPEAVIEHMDHDLGLDAEQRQKVQAILESAHDSIHTTLEGTHREIRAVLRPDQQAKFDRMRPPGLPFPHEGPPPPQ